MGKCIKCGFKLSHNDILCPKCGTMAGASHTNSNSKTAPAKTSDTTATFQNRPNRDFCPKCGTKLSSIDVLCPKCGTVVEVVQAKSSTQTVKSKSADNNVTFKNIEKKREFILYNEDLPFDEPAENQNANNSGNPEDLESFATPQNVEDPIQDNQDNNEVVQQDEERPLHQSIRELLEQNLKDKIFEDDNTLVEDELYISDTSETNISDTPEEIPEDEPAAVDKNTDNIILEDISEQSEDEAYSERYLEKIKSNSLPELDDLSGFDVDEFLREYKLGNNSNSIIPVDTESSDKTADTESSDKTADTKFSDNKRWLEIEEASSSFTNKPSETKKEPFTDAQQTTGRRYRRSDKPVSYSTKKIGRDKSKRHKKPSVLISVILWAVLAGALLVCFVFFDHYVKNTYGGYNSFINTITDGKISIDESEAQQ